MTKPQLVYFAFVQVHIRVQYSYLCLSTFFDMCNMDLLKHLEERPAKSLDVKKVPVLSRFEKYLLLKEVYLIFVKIPIW